MGRIYLISLVSFLLLGCGGGGGTSGAKNYCSKQEHVSKYGTCMKITDVTVDTDSKNIYTNEKFSVNLDYEDGFIGEEDSFTYEVKVKTSKEEISKTININQFPITLFTDDIGKVTITITVKDKDAILDSKSTELNIIKRPKPILKVQKDETLIEPYGKLVLKFDGSDNAPKQGKYEDIKVPLNIKVTLSVNGNKIVKNLQYEDNNGNIKYDSNITFDLKEGEHKVNILLTDDYNSTTEKNITLNLPITTEFKELSQILNQIKESSKNGELYIVYGDKIEVLNDESLEVKKTFNNLGDNAYIDLSTNNTKLSIINKNTIKIYNSNNFNNAILDKNISGTTVKCGDENVTFGHIDDNNLKVDNNGNSYFIGYYHDNSNDVNIKKFFRLDINGTLNCFDNHDYLDKFTLDNNDIIRLNTDDNVTKSVYSNGNFKNTLYPFQEYTVDELANDTTFKKCDIDSVDYFNKNIIYSYGCSLDLNADEPRKGVMVGEILPISDLSNNKLIQVENRDIFIYNTETKEKYHVKLNKFIKNEVAKEYNITYANINSENKNIAVGRTEDGNFIIAKDK